MRSNISFSLNSSCQSITSSQSRNDSSALSPIYPPQYPTSLAQQHHNPSYNTSPANQQVNVLSNTQVQQPAHADQMYPPTTKPVNFEAPQHYNTIPNNPTQPQFHWPLGNHHLPHQPPQTHLEYLLDEEEPIIPRTKSLPGASRSFHTNNFGSLFKNTTELLINNTDTTKDDEINHPNQIDRDVASGEESVADNENCERCKQLEEENNRLKQKIFSFGEYAFLTH